MQWALPYLHLKYVMLKYIYLFTVKIVRKLQWKRPKIQYTLFRVTFTILFSSSYWKRQFNTPSNGLLKNKRICLSGMSLIDRKCGTVSNREWKVAQTQNRGARSVVQCCGNVISRLHKWGETYAPTHISTSSLLLTL